MVEKMWNKFVDPREKGKKNTNPSRIIVLNFIFVIIIGTLLLLLPIATKNRKSTDFITALFTSISAVCVTGMAIVPFNEYWSVFGKTVVIVLIQIGGLGLTSILIGILVMVGEKITLADRVTIGAIHEKEEIGATGRLVKLIVTGTFILEVIVAIILAVMFYFKNSFTIMKSLGYGFFHSISLFCNAGYDLLGDSSLSIYIGNIFVNILCMTVIFISGIGFAVWIDTLDIIKNLGKRKKLGIKKYIRNLSLHSKIVLSMSFALILFGGLFFLIMEFNNPLTLGSLTLGNKIMASFFHSVSLRTAGFYTIEFAGFRDISKFISMILMLIGGSPGGTSGGIKTVIIGIIFLSIISTVKGEKKLKVFNTPISDKFILESIAVLGIYLVILIFGITFLSITENINGLPLDFMDIVVEVVGATSTTGLSTGLTPYLSIGGKIIIMICMLLGRIGPINTISGIFYFKDDKKNIRKNNI